MSRRLSFDSLSKTDSLHKKGQELNLSLNQPPTQQREFPQLNAPLKLEESKIFCLKKEQKRKSLLLTSL